MAGADKAAGDKQKYTDEKLERRRGITDGEGGASLEPSVTGSQQALQHSHPESPF